MRHRYGRRRVGYTVHGFHKPRIYWSVRMPDGFPRGIASIGWLGYTLYRRACQ